MNDRIRNLVLARLAYYPSQVTKLQRYTDMPDAKAGFEMAQYEKKEFAEWLHGEDSSEYWECLTDKARGAYIESKTGDPAGSIRDLDNTDVVRGTWGDLDLRTVSPDYFEAYVKEHRDSMEHSQPGPSTPSFLDFRKVDTVKNQWLIHMTPNPAYAVQIAKEGFQGNASHKYLSLTEGRPKVKEGYNFAYLAVDAKSKSQGDYGRNMVLFMGSGILYEQISDDSDSQVIFWGPTARYRMAILYDSVEHIWYVGDKRRPLKSGPVEVVVQWCIDNFQQYRKQLVPSWSAPVKQPGIAASKVEL